MENILEETRYLMKKYKIKANKSLGQNFLINSEVVENIVNCSEITNEDMVIEIGPGLGTLTKYLLEKAGKVLCIELDSKMINILEDRFSIYNNFEIINADVLKLDLNDIISENKKQEVADRLIEIPGSKNTGAITYTVYYYCDSEKIMEVPNSSFIPEPEVTSEVIKMNLRDTPIVEIENPKVMFMVIKSAFMQRRKTLLNALTNTKVFLNKEEGLKVLKNLNLNENIRAEELTIQDFSNIARIITERKN